jgi:ribonuclease E
MNQLELEMVRREKPLSFEAPPEDINEVVVVATEPVPAADENHEAVAPQAEGVEIKKKKRRRKKKVKVEGELPAGGEAAANTTEYPAGETILEEAQEEAGPIASEGSEAGIVNELKPTEHKKKRRRRRRRGKGGVVEGEGAVEAASTLEPAQEVKPVPEPQPGPDIGEEKEEDLPKAAVAEPARKPRRKQAPRKKKVPVDELVEAAEKPDE